MKEKRGGRAGEGETEGGGKDVMERIAYGSISLSHLSDLQH